MLRLLAFCLMLAPLLDVGPSCVCKKHPPTLQHWKLHQELRDYTQYPVGSWWVYRNIVNGVEDSLYLKSTDTGTYFHKGEDAMAEYFSDTLFSSIRGLQHGRAASTGDYISQYLRGPINSSWTIDDKFFWKDQMQPGVSGVVGLRFGDLLDSFRMGDSVYTEVAVFDMPGEPAGFFQYRNHWAKGIGLIQEAFYTPEGDSAIWQLQRWHINK